MGKDKDEEQFRQDVCEHSGIVARQQMRVSNAKIVGGTGITTVLPLFLSGDKVTSNIVTNRFIPNLSSLRHRPLKMTASSVM